MTDPDPVKIYLEVKKAVEAHPSLGIHILQGVTDGLQAAAEKAHNDRIEWETVALVALEGRLFAGSNKGMLADRIESLNPRAAFKWDRLIDRLRGK